MQRAGVQQGDVLAPHFQRLAVFEFDFQAVAGLQHAGRTILEQHQAVRLKGGGGHGAFLWQRSVSRLFR